MAATKSFIKKRVGSESVGKYSLDALAVQELLVACGYLADGQDDGKWGPNSAKALKGFQDKQASTKVPVRDYVEPGDECLVLMASRGNMLIEIGGKAGIPGVLDMHAWFRRNDIRYNPGAERGSGNRAIFGVDARPELAVQTTGTRFKKGPVEMDCTTYVNLMLSIYRTGTAHAVPYDADCSKFGAVSAVHCARDRYQLPLVTRIPDGPLLYARPVNFFSTAQQIRAAVASTLWQTLYVLEVGGKANGGVSHMALLIGSPEFRVYECTTGQTGSACIDRSIDEFLANKGGAPMYLFGPSA